MPFQYRKLKDQRGVEHHIRLFLERINPFHLAADDRRTAGYRLARGKSAVLVIAHYPAQQTDIRRWYPVVVINIDGRQRRNEDLESQTFIYIW